MTKDPVLLSKWYEYAKWLLERVENIPKSQRFVLGQRLADGAMDVMELLVEAAYTREKKTCCCGPTARWKSCAGLCAWPARGGF